MAYTSPSITTSGTTFAQFQAGGVGGILERLIAANLAATAAPTAPTLSATGGGSTGGSLPAGAIYVKVTETNGVGETTASTEVNVTIAATNIPQVTFAALQTGNTARNVYVGTATGAEVLYATGVTASTANLSAALPTNSLAVAPPTVNTTGLTSTNAATGVVGNRRLSNLRACKNGRLQQVWDNLDRAMAAFAHGDPMTYTEAVAKLREAHTTFSSLAQTCADAGALINANPGTLSVTANPIGNRKAVRQWP